jgi:polyhydroxyalkanoate synthase
VNPPDANRREFWIDASLPDAADKWLAQARRVPGSWWPHWMQWLKRWSGPSAGAPQMLGNAQYPPLGLAPGDYVREPAQ